ncbi:hypothetical protein FACS1894216_14730 [Synergistales bacterium]|nr:hypothetical protein FACS1894216_14730 [Synergistales bacterium]
MPADNVGNNNQEHDTEPKDTYERELPIGENVYVLLDEARNEAEEYKKEAAHAKADFYNYRARVERDRARDRTLAAESAVESLLPVLDNLDRTLEAVPDKESSLCKGVSMVQRQFLAALKNLGLSVIETDGKFDPSRHEAVMTVGVTDDEEDGKVLEELHRGYILGGKVLSAAKVKVGKKKQ